MVGCQRVLGMDRSGLGMRGKVQSVPIRSNNLLTVAPHACTVRGKGLLAPQPVQLVEGASSPTASGQALLASGK